MTGMLLAGDHGHSNDRGDADQPARRRPQRPNVL
jgi:hypothetical protein